MSKIKKIQRIEFELKTNRPLLARLIIIKNFPRLIKIAEVQWKLGESNLGKPVRIAYIPKIKIIKE